MKKSFSERRKIVESIPSGQYCYMFNGETGVDEDGLTWHGTDVCPYWKSISRNKEGFTDKAKCMLYNIKDHYSQDLTLLWDQCKICSIKIN